MTMLEFATTWDLSADELKRECASGRLLALATPDGARGYKNIHFIFRDIRAWVARKRKMPASIRAKVEAAGGLDLLERWRLEQWKRCKINPLDDTLTLPDGTLLTDVRIYQQEQH
jgi:hypothetical protein